MSGTIYAPWTDEEVEALNAFQRNGRSHPFTCGSGNRSDQAHATAADVNDLTDAGQLVATRSGWVCLGCDYTQNWAHGFMVEVGKTGWFDPFADLGAREAPGAQRPQEDPSGEPL